MIFCLNIQVRESHSMFWGWMCRELMFPLSSHHCHQHVCLVSIVKCHHGYLHIPLFFCGRICQKRKQDVWDFSLAGNYLEFQETPLRINMTLKSQAKDSHFAISFPGSSKEMTFEELGVS